MTIFSFSNLKVFLVVSTLTTVFGLKDQISIESEIHESRVQPDIKPKPPQHKKSETSTSESKTTERSYRLNENEKSAASTFSESLHENDYYLHHHDKLRKSLYPHASEEHSPIEEFSIG
jgi:hypothetical protein